MDPIEKEKKIAQEVIDSAKRMADAVNLHVVALALGVRERHLCWVAINLADGRSDGNLYESRRDAVRHTTNKPGGWFYPKVGEEKMSEREAIIVLQMARQAYASGIVFAEEDVMVPHLAELAAPFIPNTLAALNRKAF